MRKTVVQALKAFDAVAVENPCRPGTPDVNYNHGWIELKKAVSPKDPRAPVRCRHFTEQQRRWILRRHRAGGTVYVLLQLDRGWLLLPPQFAAARLDRACRAELFDNALCHWQSVQAGKVGLFKWLISDARMEKALHSRTVSACC